MRFASTRQKPMPHPRFIDLNTGRDRLISRCERLTWGLALAIWLASLGDSPGVLALAGLAVLIHTGAVSVFRARPPGRLRLFREGSANSDGVDGSWSPAPWHSGLLCLLRLELRLPTGPRRELRWICPGNNPPENYRRLRVWLNYDPRPSGPEGESLAPP